MGIGGMGDCYIERAMGEPVGAIPFLIMSLFFSLLASEPLVKTYITNNFLLILTY